MAVSRRAAIVLLTLLLAPALATVAAAAPLDAAAGIAARLRGDALETVLGLLLVFVALVALGLVPVQRRGERMILVAFSLFALVEGGRLLLASSYVGLLLGREVPAGRYAFAFLSYVITVPVSLFFEQLVEGRWRGWVRRLWQSQLAIAVLAMAADLARGQPGWANLVGQYVVLASCLAGILVLLLPGRAWGRELRLVRVGLMVLMVTAFAASLGNVGLAPWRLHTDPWNFIFLVACLGWAAALRVVGTERRLLALSHELETARRIQASILPRAVPTTKGLDVAVRYVPAAAVAGDFYDFLVVDDRRLGVFVADVSGHGVPAALVASMVKVAAGSHAHLAAEPARFLSALNHTLCGHLDGPFVTAGYLLVDTGAGRITYAGAGHPPPLVSGGGGVEAIDANGLLMGFDPGAAYMQAERAVLPGDRLVLYTDGVIEAASPAGDFYDRARLEERLRRDGAPGAAAFGDGLLAEIAAWTGRGRDAFDDDVTLVVVDIRKDDRAGA